MSFRGFPARMDFTPVPNVFINRLVPQMGDIAEVKVTLHLFAALYRKRGPLRSAAYRELLGDAGLMGGLGKEGQAPEEALRYGLDSAVKRGTVLSLMLSIDGVPEEVYFLNTEPDRRAIARLRSGELALAGFKAPGKATAAVPDQTPNVFALYEQNIGMLTPMIAEELREAERQYPEEWIEDAIREAVSLNKRSWRYIARILERWAAEGKTDGEEKGQARKTESDRYSGQKYGHLFRH